MVYNTLLYEKAEGIAKVIINRPESLNALNKIVYSEIYDVFKAIESDDEVRAVILTGSGTKAFAAGTDLVDMRNMNTLDVQKFLANIRRASDSVYNLPMPTIAAVNGFALGGGCEISMCCDLRICSDNARFGQPEINLALIPGACGTQRLPRLIGMTKAKEMIFLGDMIDAATAFNLGLVNKVVPSDKLMDEAMNWARKLARKSGPVLAMAKMSLNTGVDTDVNSGLNTEAQCATLCFATEDLKEGIEAFIAKRTPEFKNR